MIVFPAIDILDGACVRLMQGQYDEVTEYAKDPSEMVSRWEEEGASWIHVVDLDGARDGHPVNLSTVEKMVKKANVSIQYGGGVRNETDLKTLLDIGVNRVVVGTAMIKDEEFAQTAIKKYGPQLVAGIDAKGGRVSIEGWIEDTNIRAVDLANKLKDMGVARIVYTDISVDGTSQGPSIATTKDLAEALGIPVIASGGVSSLWDIEALEMVSEVGIEGVIVGRALYENTFSLAEAIEAAKQ
ncbi:MAG: 1-(5-phosphoribosyl)-5-[(5-phosphoribosylamino)methylideneamino]imidazole-4-carboxamide isomerase [Actinomycetia bacterium]|nr:1-(5-phosphoribosyl)-5-[(5-phosphoribosylamino)methylideneamino]imidazole-4-carboxamide isomerase [Actinomycetes bacterium]